MREVAGESKIASVMHPDWELSKMDTVDEKAAKAQQMERASGSDV